MEAEANSQVNGPTLALGMHPSYSRLDSREISDFSPRLSAILLAAVSKLFSMVHYDIT